MNGKLTAKQRVNPSRITLPDHVVGSEDANSRMSWKPSAAFLRYSIFALLAGSLCFLLVIFIATPEQTVRAIGPAAVALVATTAWFLLALGKVRTTLHFLAFGSWMTLTLIAVFNGGVRTTSIVAYPVIIMMIGWLMGARAALIAAGGTVVAIVGFMLAEAWGVLPKQPFTPSAMYGVVQIVIVVVSVALVNFLVRSYEARLRDLDQTGRELAQRNLDVEASRADLNHAQAVAKVGSWVYDLVADTMSLSAETCRIFGLPEGTVGNHDAYLRRTYPDDREVVDSAWQAALKGAKFDREHRIVIGRTIRWVRQRAELEFAPDGTALRAVGVSQDITERKAVQEQLQLAANVFVNAGEGIIITDGQGHIIDVNQAFSRITGYGREEVLGHSPSILKSGRQDQAFYDAMWRDLLRLGHWSGEIWNRRRDGEVYAELLTISAVRDGAGTVQNYVGLFVDLTAIKAHQSQLEHIAHFDALTNLPNRVLLADRMQQAMVQTQRRGQQLAVAYLDLDGFKAINDHHGHQTGDQVLVTLTQRMKLALREGDTLARLGGDEFVAVLIDLEDTAACEPLVRRLLAAAAQPIPLGDLQLQVSASVGVTFYPQPQDMDADQLLRQADQAMYQAKVAGKNRYQLFDAEQDSSIRSHHESLERIRLALSLGEFVLYYQPKVNMRSGKIMGAEALIRWQHPEKGLLAPALFLPTIEDHPLAVTVGEWVIDSALSQIELWHAAGLDLPVSVNIGARQLQQSDFVQRLQALLAAHPQVNPKWLELEVLETSALGDMVQVSQVIEDCAQIGVMFAMDDFGTGYSSLTYLKRLRVNLLKIDQSFVRDMLEDPDDLAILQGVIGLAAAFKHQVIAEGVETIAHGTALLQLGCELGQGYGIARPMPAAQMPTWVASWQPDAAWCDLPWLGGIEQDAEG